MALEIAVELGGLWIGPLAVFLLFIAAGYLIRKIIGDVVTGWVDKSPLETPKVVLRSIRGFIVPWSALVGLGVASHLVSLSPELQGYADKAVVVLLIISATFPAVTIVSGLLQTVGAKVEKVEPVAGALTRMAQLVIWAVVAMMVLSYLSVDITPALTTMGLAGLAAALALQDTLANFFAGFYILADRPVRTGDYIKLDSGDEGFVTEIGWRSTRIRTLPNNIVVIPNQKLAQAVITNYSLPEPRMSLLLNVGVSYQSDPRHVERVLVEVASEASQEIPGMLSEPAPFVRFIPGFGAYSLDFTLICQVKEFVDQYYVQHELRKRIFERFKAEGIEIPFPITTIHWPDGKAAQVRQVLESEAGAPKPPGDR